MRTSAAATKEGTVATQAKLGYVNFFIWACVATVPSFVAAALIRIDPAFGRKVD